MLRFTCSSTNSKSPKSTNSRNKVHLSQEYYLLFMVLFCEIIINVFINVCFINNNKSSINMYSIWKYCKKICMLTSVKKNIIFMLISGNAILYVQFKINHVRFSFGYHLEYTVHRLRPTLYT